MKVMERIIQQIDWVKWAEFVAAQSKFEAVEARLGFPPMRWYRTAWGAENSGTVVCEREWESLAVMEATYEAGWADEERRAMESGVPSYIVSHRQELWYVGLEM